VHPPVKSEAQCIVDARVSSADQKNDLDQQIARVNGACPCRCPVI
jgi:predicted site-specific integrase-resolvase